MAPRDTLLNELLSKPAPRRPWKALGSYAERDQDLFFGRDADRDALIDLVLSSPSTVLYGASGAGKTSLLNAAVVPALRARGCAIARVRSAGSPLETLRAAVYAAWPAARPGRATRVSIERLVQNGAPLPLSIPRLRALMASSFDRNELRLLVGNLQEHAPDLDLDLDSGPLQNSIDALIWALQRRGQVEVLLGELYAERPKLHDELDKLLEAGQHQALASAPLDQIEPASQQPQTVVVVCDEFEKFFLDDFVRPDARPPFITEVAGLSARDDLPLRWVFSLRKEALGDLFIHFEPHSKSLVANLYRLDALSRDEAAAAVRGPAERTGLGLEPALVQKMLDDLDTHGQISPPQLQLVCDELYNQALSRHTHQLTLADYERIGGMHGILHNYLERVLDRFKPDEMPVVRELLIQLAGAQQTTLALSLVTLAERLQQPPQRVGELVRRLAGANLVREGVVGGLLTYELTHAYLISEIDTWVDRGALALRRIQALVARGVSNQAPGQRLPLSREELDLIFPHRTSLRLSREERRLVWHSAVHRGDRLEEWCPLCPDEEDQLSILQADPPLDRRRVSEALRWLPSRRAERELLQLSLKAAGADDRRHAAGLLAKRAGLETHLELLAEAQRLPRRERAPHVAALAALYDERLSGPLPWGLGVRRELCRMRLRRESDYMIYLVIGAALGSLPLFTLIKDQSSALRLEPIGLGLAGGLGAGYAIARRHRAFATIVCATLGGLLGGLLSGMISGFSESSRVDDLAGLLGLISLYALAGATGSFFSALGMLLAMRTRDTPLRRTVGLGVGALGIPLFVLALVGVVWLSGAPVAERVNLHRLGYIFADAILISVGIGVAHYLYRSGAGRALEH